MGMQTYAFEMIQDYDRKDDVVLVLEVAYDIYSAVRKIKEKYHPYKISFLSVQDCFNDIII